MSEKTLLDLRHELWAGTSELFNKFFASIVEQQALTEQQEVTLEEYLQLGREAVESRDQLAEFIITLEQHADELKARISRLESRRKEFSSLAGMFRSSILAKMQNSGALSSKRIDGFESSFRVHDNPRRVEIYDEALIPGRFIEYPPKYRLREIGDALAAGEEVPGARWAEKTSHLEIK
jgi:hypothetical protein